MGSKTEKIIRWWGPAILWMAVIMSVSSLPKSQMPVVPIPNIDKIAHAIEYLILGLLVVRALLNSSINTSLARLMIIAVVFSAAYAALDEWHQQFIPGRETDIFDFLADFAGINIGVFLYRYSMFRQKLV